MQFSQFFNINANQSQLDFVDIPLETDIALFIDPYAVSTTNTEFGNECHRHAKAFFQDVLSKIRKGSPSSAKDLLVALREDNRTRLGYSRGKPKGKALGPDRARSFLAALKNSPAFTSGKISDIDEISLFVDGIGSDIMSDMMTGVLRQKLITYTNEQCELYGIQLLKSVKVRVWNTKSGWETISANLPVANGQTVLLIPRSIVRKNLSLTPNTYLTSIFDQIDSGVHAAGKSLSLMLQIQTKKNGKMVRGSARDGLRDKGAKKNVLSEIAHRETLDKYKADRRLKMKPLTAADIEEVSGTKSTFSHDLIADEMVAASRNAATVMDAARQLSQIVLSSMFPFFQHPRIFDTGVAGTVGVRLANISKNPFFTAARRRNPNVLYIVVSRRIDNNSFNQLNTVQMMKNAHAGAAIVVGAGLNPSMKQQRHSLRKKGIVLTSAAEMAAITSQDAAPDLIVDLLASLA